MAISEKGRRKILVGEVTYLWWVEPWHDDAGDALHVVSRDGQLHLLVGLGRAVVISTGDRFGSRTGLRGPWRRFLAPFALPAAVTPSVIRALIEWAISAEANLTEIG